MTLDTNEVQLSVMSQQCAKRVVVSARISARAWASPDVDRLVLETIAIDLAHALLRCGRLQITREPYDGTNTVEVSVEVLESPSE